MSARQVTPHYADDWLTVYGGDCREVLASLPADSVDCVVTSPPYWGLRSYLPDSVTMRPDLTDEQRAYLQTELAARGIVPTSDGP